MASADAELRRSAALARLPLTDDEARQLAVRIGAIIAHADALAELEAVTAAARSAEAGDAADTAAAAAAVADAAIVVDSAAPRPDTPGADRLHLPPAAFAPAWAEGFFTVPRTHQLM
jgi:Asp-tRNA(Asn)/Glu-tRNA(Gln) amidotransferase C subunit